MDRANERSSPKIARRARGYSGKHARLELVKCNGDMIVV